MARGKTSKATPKRKTMGRKGRIRTRKASAEGRGPESGRIEYGPILSVPEAATYLRVTVRTIYRLKAKGGLPFARVGGRILFRRVDIEEFVEQRLHRESPRGRQA